MADWMSCDAASMLRPRSNCTVICVEPSTLVDVSCATPGICEIWFSSGVATDEAMVSGLAPGNWVVIRMVGKSTCGSGATGNSGKAASPIRKIAAISSEVAMGRAMNGDDRLTVRCFRWPCPEPARCA